MKKFFSLLVCTMLLICAVPTLAVSPENESVKFVVNHHLMSCDENGNFNPEQPVSRAMLVTIMYRHWENAGKPALPTSNTGWAHFYDVPDDCWYTIPVYWAYNAGIINGIGKNSFDPDSPITIEQFASMFERAGWLETEPDYTYMAVVQDLGGHKYSLEAMSKLSKVLGFVPSPTSTCHRNNIAYYLYMMWR